MVAIALATVSSDVQVRTTVMRRLKARQTHFGCDHRAVFATTYRVLTEQMVKALRENPHLFADPKYLYTEDALFASVYINNVHAWEAGKRVSPAWQIAFSSAENGDLNAAQDMLLGINAHVQNDMAFVIASLSTAPRKGGLTYADHEVENGVLANAYQAVVDEIRRRYDPLLDVTNSSATPLDDEAGLTLVKQWREDVWKHANELEDAKTQADDDRITNDTEQNAADWAALISGQGLAVPGYRSYRDAYCATHNPDA